MPGAQECHLALGTLFALNVPEHGSAGGGPSAAQRLPAGLRSPLAQGLMTGAGTGGKWGAKVEWSWKLRIFRFALWVCTPKPNGFADHYPYEKWLFHWEYTLFSDKPIWSHYINGFCPIHSCWLVLMMCVFPLRFCHVWSRPRSLSMYIIYQSIPRPSK